jgi:PAS domain S-box-containing protein
MTFEELEAENARLRAELTQAGLDARHDDDRRLKSERDHHADLARSHEETSEAQRHTRTAQVGVRTAAREHDRLMSDVTADLTASQGLVAELRASRLALAKSEARQRAIFDSALSFAMVVTDPTGIVTDWNPGTEEVMGWSAEEMRESDIERIFTSEDRAISHAAYEMGRALQDGRTMDERWHLRKDGSRFWASG